MKHFKNKIKIDCYFLEDFYFPMFVLVPLLNTGLLIAKCPFLKIIIFLSVFPLTETTCKSQQENGMAILIYIATFNR